MKVFITGIGGMLGNDLCEALESSFKISGIGRKKIKLKSGKMKYFSCDLLDGLKLTKIIGRMRPDVVIHAAAKTQVDECELNPQDAYRDNVLAVQILVDAARTYKSLMIYISTDYVFDGGKKTSYKESDEERPLSVYGATKYLGEEIIRNSGLAWMIIRTTWLYGSNGPNFIKSILKSSETKKQLKVVTDQHGSPTFTRDLAQAIRRILITWKSGERAGGLFHVTNQGVTNWNAFARIILKSAGKNHVKILPCTAKQLARPARRPENSVLDNAKFTRQFKFRMRPWQEALKEYLGEMK